LNENFHISEKEKSNKSMSRKKCFELSAKKRVIKNLFAFNIAFFLTFTATNAITSIQNVLNKTGGLGITVQVVSFTTQMFSCLCFPQMICQLLGFKWALALAQCGLLTFLSINLLPSWYSMIPAAMCNGFSQALIWTILGLYMSALAQQYADITGQLFKNVQTFFSCIFSAIFLLSYVFGSLMMKIFLTTEPLEKSNTTFNYTQYCGAKYCRENPLPKSASEPSRSAVYKLCGVMIAILACGLLTGILFVDNIQKKEPKTDALNRKKKNCCTRLIISFKKQFSGLYKLFQNVDVYLLCPLTVYTGFEVTILWTEVYTSFVNCVFGIKYIGWISMLFGYTGFMFSIIYAYTTKYVTLQPMIVLMLMISFSNNIIMLVWQPNPNSIYIIFIVAIGLGLSQAYAAGQARGKIFY